MKEGDISMLIESICAAVQPAALDLLGQMPDGLRSSALGDRQHTPLRGVGR
jgi:hypothetical protein